MLMDFTPHQEMSPTLGTQAISNPHGVTSSRLPGITESPYITQLNWYFTTDLALRFPFVANWPSCRNKRRQNPAIYLDSVQNRRIFAPELRFMHKLVRVSNFFIFSFELVLINKHIGLAGMRARYALLSFRNDYDWSLFLHVYAVWLGR